MRRRRTADAPSNAGQTARRRARVGLVIVWMLVALAGTAASAKAVGLPFVDLPKPAEIASNAIDSASRAIVDLIASSVAALTNEIIKVSDTVAAPQVGSGNAWFTASYKRTMGVSLYLMAIAALVAVTAAGIRGKVGEMLGVIFVSVPGSIVAMMLVTVGVQLALGLVDAMTAYTFRGSVDQIQTFLHDIGTTFTATDGAAQGSSILAPGLTLIIGLLVIVAQLVILAVLVVRSALIYIVTLFLPLVLAVQVWPASRHMTRKALELLAVLIFSKFAIFTCFALGASAASDILEPAASSGAPPAVQSAIVGFGIMAAAAFSPMLLMSIIPGIAGSFGGGMPGGTSGAGALAVRTPSQIMRSTLSSVHTVRGGERSRGSSSSARRGQGHSSASRTTPPPSTGARGGASSGASAASEGAHAGPAAAAAATAGRVLAQGAAAPAKASAGMANAGTRSNSPASPDSPAREGASAPAPHIVGSARSRSSRSDAASPAADRSAPHIRSERRSVPGAAPATHSDSGDGFASVQTRQPFTLETT